VICSHEISVARKNYAVKKIRTNYELFLKVFLGPKKQTAQGIKGDASLSFRKPIESEFKSPHPALGHLLPSQEGREKAIKLLAFARLFLQMGEGDRQGG
jgi:hypothetical protein